MRASPPRCSGGYERADRVVVVVVAVTVLCRVGNAENNRRSRAIYARSSFANRPGGVERASVIGAVCETERAVL